MGLRTLGVLAVVVLVACATPPPGPMTVESAKFPDVRTCAKREPPKTVRFVLRAVPLSGRSEGGRFRQPPRTEGVPSCDPGVRRHDTVAWMGAR